jgi:hypothetical protein
MTLKLLPAEFADLAHHADEWALPSEQERHRKRNATDLATVHALYAALFPRMDAVMSYLARYPVDGFDRLPVEVQNLHNLALAFMENSHPVDMDWRTVDIEDAFPSERFIFQAPSNVR